MSQYFSIDDMKPGESVVLLVTATNPDSDKWPKRTPVTVTAGPRSWYYESPFGATITTVKHGPKVNPGHQGLNAHMKGFTGVPWPVESIRESDLIRRAYRAERRKVATGQARILSAESACYALHRARLAVANGTDSSYGPDSIWAGLGGSDGATFEAHGESRCRWFENPESRGLRFLGLAHDVGKAGNAYLRDAVDHRGWYLDSDRLGETIAGVVYQLPGRDGRARYLAGYADPHNTDSDGRGPACLSLEVFAGERLDSSWDNDSVIRDAARRGDSMAESYASDERDYQDARLAGVGARELAQEALEACARWTQAVKAARAVYRNRNRINRADARLLFKAQADSARDYCQEFLEARKAARDARDAAPGKGYGGRINPTFDGWQTGYNEGV